MTKFMKIAYLGIPGSYSYIAGQKYFKNKKMIGYNNIRSVFQKVSENTCRFGIVPLENTTTGSIFETYDLLLTYKLAITGEVVLKIHHHLLAKEILDMKNYKFCYSHPQAIQQCKTISDKFPWLKFEFTQDTASAAKLLAEKNNHNKLAIGSREAALIYKLKIVQKNIEDNKNNMTRFAVIANKIINKGNKISLIFTVKHQPGSLVKALKPYTDFGFNLTKIESRPIISKPWEYMFILEMDLNNKSKLSDKLFSEMKKVTNFLKLLGRYDKGKIYDS